MQPVRIHRSHAFCLFLPLLIFAETVPAAGQCVNYPDYLHLASVVTLPSSVQRRMAVSAGRVYVAGGSVGLHLVDVSNSHQANLVRTLDTPGGCVDVQVKGSTAYVADGTSGLQIVSLSNPNNPVIAGNWNPGTISVLALSGNLLAAAGGGVLRLADVTNPASPVPLGTVPVSGIGFDMEIAGSHLYAGGTTGLTVVDLSNTASPTVVGSYPASASGDIVGVDVEGNHAYIIDNPAGFELGLLNILNVSTPSSPGLVGSEGFYYAFDVAVLGNHACVLSGFDPVLYDVTNPASPVAVNSIPNAGFPPRRVIWDSGHIYVGSDTELRVYDVPSIDPPTPVATVYGPALDIKVRASNACTCGSSYFQTYDVSVPSSPVELSDPLNLGPDLDVYEAERLDVSGNLAAISRYTEGLRLVDVTTMAVPALRGLADTPGEAWDVALSGNYAYVADGSGGLGVVQVTNPNAPTWLTDLATPGVAYGLTISGSVLYLADGTAGLRTYDLSNPALPSFLGSIDTPGTAWDVTVRGGYAYVNDIASLRVIDVSNPASPVFRGRVERPGLDGGVVLSGDFAYVGAGDAAMVVFNVALPAAPMLVGEYHDSGAPGYGLAVVGNYIYSANDYHGINVLLQQCPNTSSVPDSGPIPSGLALSPAYPNPSRGAVRFTWKTQLDAPSGATSGAVVRPAITALITDLSGRLVRRLPSGFGPHSEKGVDAGIITWDGHDEVGRTAPAGIYFLRLSTERETAVQRFVRFP